MEEKRSKDRKQVNRAIKEYKWRVGQEVERDNTTRNDRDYRRVCLLYGMADRAHVFDQTRCAWHSQVLALEIGFRGGWFPAVVSPVQTCSNAPSTFGSPVQHSPVTVRVATA
eukprot:719991-Pyramimonas_sp.AAC.1